MQSPPGWATFQEHRAPLRGLVMVAGLNAEHWIFAIGRCSWSDSTSTTPGDVGVDDAHHRMRIGSPIGHRTPACPCHRSPGEGGTALGVRTCCPPVELHGRTVRRIESRDRRLCRQARTPFGVLDPMGSRAEPADPHPGGSDKEQDDGSEERNEGEARKNPRSTCVLEGLRPFAGGPLSAVSVLGVEDQRTDVESGAHDDQ